MEIYSNLIKHQNIQTYFTENYLTESPKNLLAFGSNEMGQLGQPQSISSLKFTPYPVNIAISSPIQFSLGYSHSVVLTKSKVFSWGACACGQLGLDLSDNSNFIYDLEGYAIQPTPKEIPSLSNVKIKSIACGDAHTLALTENGDIYSCIKYFLL